MNRRQFLKWLGLGTGTLLAGSLCYRLGYQWRQSPAPGFEVLSQSEAKILEGIVDAVFPGEPDAPGSLPNGVDLELVDYFDGYLADLRSGAQRFLLTILHAIDDVSRLESFDLRPFYDRDRSERIDLLRNWENSTLMIRRAGFKAIRYELANRYCLNKDVRDVLGIEFICQGD